MSEYENWQWVLRLTLIATLFALFLSLSGSHSLFSVLAAIREICPAFFHLIERERIGNRNEQVEYWVFFSVMSSSCSSSSCRLARVC